jgi:hypothetical protein
MRTGINEYWSGGVGLGDEDNLGKYVTSGTKQH